MEEQYEPLIVAFAATGVLCRGGFGRGLPDSVSPNGRIIRVMCSGMVTQPGDQCLTKGADGVLVVGDTWANVITWKV